MAETISQMKKQIAQLETEEAADKYFADQANFVLAKRKIETIDNFNGVFDFLNNEFPCDVFYEGIVYPSIFHGMQGARAQQEHERQKISMAETMQELFELATQIEDPPNWSVDRLLVMEKLLRDKFRRSRELRDKLLKTGNRTLINSYADRTVSNLFWGMVDGKGENHVGRLLEAIRLDAHLGKDLQKWLTMLLQPIDDKVLIPSITLEVYKEASKLEDTVLARKGYNIIGLLPENDLVAAHPSISRQHACVLSDAKRGVVLLDLGSKCGTFLNGEPLEPFLPSTLKDGDWFSLGQSTRKYVIRIDYREVREFLQKKARNLELDMKILSLQASLPAKDEQVRAGLGLTKYDTVYLAGLPDNCSEKEIREAFEVHGKILTIRIPINTATGKSKNMAFVKYASDEAAKKAVGIFRVPMREKLVKVQFAEKDKQQVLNDLERKIDRDKKTEEREQKTNHKSRSRDRQLRKSRSRDRSKRDRSRERHSKYHRDKPSSRRRSRSEKSSSESGSVKRERKTKRRSPVAKHSNKERRRRNSSDSKTGNSSPEYDRKASSKPQQGSKHDVDRSNRPYESGTQLTNEQPESNSRRHAIVPATKRNSDSRGGSKHSSDSSLSD